MQSIQVRGARTHNLKNIDVDIPKNQLVVITGLSGSGKSSLAFDTLYAEGQRRYVESLSTYARQFLDLMERPDVDSIRGLSPAIAIEQKTSASNPRSTVGTLTEIMDYLRLLFARVGVPYCPQHHLPLTLTPISEMVDTLMREPENTRLMILAPVIRSKVIDFPMFFKDMQTQGYVRFQVDGQVYEFDEIPTLNDGSSHSVDIVVDRLKIRAQMHQRLAESLETALRLSDGIVKILDVTTHVERIFSNRYSCPECDYSLGELKPAMFSFNSPLGACPVCNGMGLERVFTAQSIVRHADLSLASGALHGWDRRNPYNFELLNAVARAEGFDIDMPWSELTSEQQNAVLYGCGERMIAVKFFKDGKTLEQLQPFEGVLSIMQRRYADGSAAVKNEMDHYRELRPCSACGGSRLKQETRYVYIGEGEHKKAIYDIAAMPLRQAWEFFKTLTISGTKRPVAEKLTQEIELRLRFLNDVGLGYLSLDRKADTLSGGEMQRIRLASQIGSGLTGVMYVLDEPSIGLHQRDNDRLIKTMQYLKELGNTVIVVEHDEDTIRAADYVIDMGPGAGELGGRVMAVGTPEQLQKDENSLTGEYLSGKKQIEVRDRRLAEQARKLRLIGARGNNLKDVTLEIPEGLITVVAGVSGSGKSTLVNDTLYRIAAKALYRAKEAPEPYDSIEGLEMFDKVINVDQSPIGRSPRSNPATYTGSFNSIRELFAQTPTALERGYDSGRFSFNVKGGRCEACQGDGYIKVEMNFLPDMYVPCEVCHGKRYNRETLDVLYKGLNIAQVLDLTVQQALEVFKTHPGLSRKLQTLMDVGLGYVRLGQSAQTLSGGEAQRMKIAQELSRKETSKTLYILDEPTTGLHFADVQLLINVLQKLRDAGNTVVVIEHNLDMIRAADWVVDMGPDGGDAGGQIVAQGTPEMIAKDPASVTGPYLKI